jgi:hypothetical protein
MSGGARHRRKGDRTERKIVQLHRAIGVHAERYPFSGASRFSQGFGLTFAAQVGMHKFNT